MPLKEVALQCAMAVRLAMRPGLCRALLCFCLFVYSWWIADKRVNCVYTIAECRHSCSIPTAPVLSLSPAPPQSLRLLGLLPWTHSPQPAYSASVVLQNTERSRSLTETIALIWIIKGLRHYDTVSLCRGGQRTNIQAHWPCAAVSPPPPPLSITLLLVLALNKLQAWAGPWM